MVLLFLWQTDRKTMLMARAQAVSSFNRDAIYRRWNASTGGVYVPHTADLPPNPYLQVPNRDVTTGSGVKLTLVNPAYMTRLVHELGFQTHGLRSHITSASARSGRRTPPTGRGRP